MSVVRSLQAGDGYNSDDHGQSGHRQAAALTSTATHRSNAPGVSAAGSARDVVDRLCAAGAAMLPYMTRVLPLDKHMFGHYAGVMLGAEYQKPCIGCCRQCLA